MIVAATQWLTVIIADVLGDHDLAVVAANDTLAARQLDENSGHEQIVAPRRDNRVLADSWIPRPPGTCATRFSHPCGLHRGRHRPAAGRPNAEEAIMPKSSRRLTEQERAERRRQDRERLQHAAQELLELDGWARWVKTRAMFHSIPVGNWMLLAAQAHGRGVALTTSPGSEPG